MDNIAGIVIGFVLTTVIGGLWATYLQQRSWTAQNEARLQEAEAARAGATCQTIMSLLDRRMYRMQRLLWAARSATSGDDVDLERRRRDYTKVLFDWNDRLNTNLSLVGTDFGEDARALLEELYEDFARVGGEIEAVLRSVRAGGSPEGHPHLDEQFLGRGAESLNDRVYEFGVTLMSQLREGTVGRRAPRKATPRARTRS